MWTWDVDEINCIHSYKRVENLSVFREIAKLLVDEGLRSFTKIAKRLDTNRITLETYRLQGKVCSGEGGWCTGGTDCLGRFRMWHTNWTPTKRSHELVKDHRDGSFEAGMLKICLKAAPHFLEFCQVLSHGAHITKQNHLYQFRISRRKKKALSLNEWKLRGYMDRRLRIRFGRDVRIPYEDIDQFVFWCKSLGIISENPSFGRLEFRVKTFEKYLDRKKIFNEFSEDRSVMEGYL